MRTLQQPLFTPETEWVPPDHLPDLSSHAEIAIDLETRDPNLLTLGSGSVRRAVSYTHLTLPTIYSV